MTTVDWAVVCDLAYFDSLDRLCLFGIETTGRTRTLQAGVHRLAFAVHLHDGRLRDERDVSLFITSPQGQCRAADEVLDFCVETRGEYVILHMPSFQLKEEGAYRFEVACGADVELALCEVNVLSQPHRVAKVHLHGAY